MVKTSVHSTNSALYKLEVLIDFEPNLLTVVPVTFPDVRLVHDTLSW